MAISLNLNFTLQMEDIDARNATKNNIEVSNIDLN